MFGKKMVLWLVLSLAMMLALAGVAYAETAAPNDKQECKKGGYERFGFRNQGLCVKAVNHTQARGLRTYFVSVPAESVTTSPGEGGGVTYTWKLPMDIPGCIKDVNVALNGFSAQNPSDLTIELTEIYTNPTTQEPVVASSTLMNHQGGSDPVSNVDLSFDDAAQTIVPPFGPLVSGTYQPYTPLSDFKGHDAEGDWSLVVKSDTDQVVTTDVGLQITTGC